MSEKDRKRVSDKVGTWDKFITAITPGEVHTKAQRLKDIADSNEAEERRQAELAAIRAKRMNAGR